ncbi:MAG: hypothetical protein ACI8RW_001359, partial [Porticoccaceae bacterium]
NRGYAIIIGVGDNGAHISFLYISFKSLILTAKQTKSRLPRLSNIHAPTLRLRQHLVIPRVRLQRLRGTYMTVILQNKHSIWESN